MENKAIIVINTTSTYYRRMRDKGFDFPPAVHCSTNFLSGSRRENNCIYRKLIGNTHPITREKIFSDFRCWKWRKRTLWVVTYNTIIRWMEPASIYQSYSIIYGLLYIYILVGILVYFIYIYIKGDMYYTYRLYGSITHRRNIYDVRAVSCVEFWKLGAENAKKR